MAKNFHSRLTGEFNAWNLLAVYSVARLLGLSKQEVLPALRRRPGAMVAHCAAEQNLTVVLITHTPDAVEKG